jgi:putative hemolysin
VRANPPKRLSEPPEFKLSHRGQTGAELPISLTIEGVVAARGPRPAAVTMALQAEQRRRAHAHFGIEAREGRRPDWRRLALIASPALARLHRLREEARRFTDPFAVARLVLGGLEVSVDLGVADEARIPTRGAVIITANHPFGGLDGLVGIDTIGRRRHDLRVLANPELTGIDGIGSIVIPVDPFDGAKATRSNARGMRAALRWLEDEGALLIFPAGEVSSFDLRTLSVIDRPWSATAARLIRLAGGPVVPMHFAGSNGALFQIAGLLHPYLRTLLLPWELGNKIGARVVVRVGEVIAPASYSTWGADADLAAQLRLKTYVLGAAEAVVADAVRPVARKLAPLAVPIDSEALAREVESLPAQSLLASCSDMHVYCASASRLPQTLPELGRLRERTFRLVGEGTGHSADLDPFDDYYEHLFIWNAAAREIVGAYRLGRTDLISRCLGKGGLYTSTLFEFHDLFFKLLGPALELGRSFVRSEYQKSFVPLLLLWRGIGEYVGRNPACCKLLGPVSISNDYTRLSQALLVRFLRQRNFDLLAPAMVRAKRPFRGRGSLRSLGGIAQPEDLKALSALVAGLEPDGKGAPVLLRQYLKLGGRILGFNLDPQFSNSLDCLVLVDLRKTEPRVLQKYMSADAWESFSRAHCARWQLGRKRA